MKKLLILAAALLTLSSVAQTKDEEALSKKIAKSDEAIADAKKSLQANTWIARAELYIDAANLYTNQLIAGFSAEALLSQLGESAESIEDVTINGVALKKHAYPTVDVYVNEIGLIQFWQAKKEFVKDALKVAYGNLKKAKDLDPKVFNSRGSAVAMRLDNQCQTDAMTAYSLGKPNVAAQMFDGSFEAKELVGKIDTVSVYYAGAAYLEAKMHKEALDRFEKTLSLNYVQDGTIYYYIGLCQEQLGEKETALKTYETGFAKYPNNQAVMAGLINAYMVSGKNMDMLVDIVHKAQALDPKNVSLYLVESNVWDKLGDKMKAEAAMIQATKIAPDDFNVFYNYAILKVLQAEALVAEANKLDLNDVKTYNTMMEQAVVLQKVAIEKLERAYAIDSTSAGAIDMLRQLYFPRRDDNAEMQQRYDFFNGLHQKAQPVK